MFKKLFFVASVTVFALTSLPGMTFVAPAEAGLWSKAKGVGKGIKKAGTDIKDAGKGMGNDLVKRGKGVGNAVKNAGKDLKWAGEVIGKDLVGVGKKAGKWGYLYGKAAVIAPVDYGKFVGTAAKDAGKKLRIPMKFDGSGVSTKRGRMVAPVRNHRSPKKVVRDRRSPNVVVSDHRRRFIRR